MGICGIDPGLTGGIAIVHEREALSLPLETLDGVLDLFWLTDFLKDNRHMFSKVYLEKVASMPGQGVSSVFKFGRTYGAIEGVLSALGIPFYLVRPQEWQKEFFVAQGKLDPKQRKERCILAAKREFPGFNFLATQRSSVPHLGIVDALLIATYGFRKEKSGTHGE